MICICNDGQVDLRYLLLNVMGKKKWECKTRDTGDSRYRNSRGSFCHVQAQHLNRDLERYVAHILDGFAKKW